MDKFEMTTEHLARTLALGRHRERLAIAKRLVAKADELTATHPATATALVALAEELRMEATAPSVELGQRVEHVQPFADADIDQAEAEGGDGLPPVRHGDDFADGQHLARSLMGRRA